jgi:hypothetical protein
MVCHVSLYRKLMVPLPLKRWLHHAHRLRSNGRSQSTRAEVQGLFQRAKAESAED